MLLMKNQKITFTLLFLLILVANLIPIPVKASSRDHNPSPPLCPPGVNSRWEAECSSMGPNQYLNEMAQKGITFPLSPLPAYTPDKRFNEIAFNYAHVFQDRTPIYSTLEAAISGNKKYVTQRIPPGFNFISYHDVWVSGGRKFFHAQNGWTTSEHVIPVTVSEFQGLEFRKTPERTFGWFLSYFASSDYGTVRREPSFDAEGTGRVLEHLEIVQIYDTKQVGNWEWYMIAPGEWVFQTVIARVIPQTTPPEGVNSDRWIEINLYEQTLAVYENRELIFATLIATGSEPHWTYPGVFQVYEKIPETNMRGGSQADNNYYYMEDVPWTMYFDDRRALHGAYWRPRLGFPQSHGCVNLSIGDARWLYEWANLGDWVYIWDPSGKTPTK